MKKILGLDLGTNSIGWAVVNADDNGNPVKIEGMGSRIIPMGSDKIDYEKGATITKNADRRAKRSARRMGKRYKMRRNKLLFILDKLDMLPDQFQFRDGFPKATELQKLELLPIRKNTLQLDSLQHYELRAKALTEKIELKELGSILYQYNRLRGYAGGGDDENDVKEDKKDEDLDEVKKYETRVQKFVIKKVEKTEQTFKVKAGKDKGKELPVYNITVLENENEREGTTILQNLEEKKDLEVELEIRIKRTKKGESVSFALPQKTNWRKQMEETEKILNDKNYYPCQLFVEDLRKNKWTKIRNRVILRQQYTKEFDAVWEQQAKFYPVLNNCPENVLIEILNYIFPGKSESQKRLREEGLEKGLKHIIKNQVIYYQRPLKSQSDLIGKCQFEKGEQVIPISHPLFQEFRCWDQINRLYITSKENVWNEKKKKDILQYTNRYLTDEEKITIYNKLQSQKQIGFNDVARIVNLKSDNTEFLNGLNVKAKLKGCDTAITIKNVIKKILGEPYASKVSVEKVWQTLYDNVHEGSEYDPDSKRVQSVFSTLPEDIEKSLRIALALKLTQSLKFPRKYASLSRKAIENILPLMRLAPQEQDIPEIVKHNFRQIQHLIETGEAIEDYLINDYIIDFVGNNPDALEKGGLMYAFAASLVYGRHTKESVKPQITNYHDIKYDPEREKNLRNPIVSQIANETMQVVKAVWKNYQLNPNELEIRVELARDLKNSAQERDKIYKSQIKNRKINETIKKRLIELNQEVNDRNIELYKIWSRQEKVTDDEGKPIPRPKYKNENAPTKDEIEKMRLWEEQQFISPYTLQPIPLSKLFSPERLYDIDHIIPKSRYFDDSSTNKVVCETIINEEKDNRTAWEYISQQNSKLGICTPEKYLEHVNKNFFGQKKRNLLTEKIPSNPVNRQIKDTQFISVAIKNELAKIVGSENVKTTTGGVTDYLRSHWGLKKLFMELTESRFKQMEQWNLDENGVPKESWITKEFDKKRNKNIYEIKGWSKRYDHRHHAIDALVVALSNEKFIKRLNDLNKYFQDELNKHKGEFSLNEDDSLEEAFFNLNKEKRDAIMKEIESSRKFKSPIENLIPEAKKFLETMIVSQKPKDKLAITANKQLKIRAALHQETYYGKTNNRDTKTVSLSLLKAKDIEQIIDKTLQNEIDKHRKKYDTMKEAFSGEGLIAFNESRFQTKNPSALKPPVYKVKLWYSKKETEESELQQLYQDNDKKSVVTGDNYMFIIMAKNGKRFFDVASLYDSVILAKKSIKEKVSNIEMLKKSICNEYCEKNKNKPEKTLCYLQQNDLVYMPQAKDNLLELDTLKLKEWFESVENRKTFAQRVYKVVKFTGKDCFFIPNNYAKEISLPKDLSEETLTKLKEANKDKKIPKQELNYIEFGTYSNCSPLEKNELFTKLMREGKKYKGEKPRKIQDYCVKIKTDWLGNVTEFNGIKL
ncbi:type II CRISPR RNA-guided endonuclease Cas9 [bacterium]|nr:type II CRISPR RNA-guided endonuclease Cas9 [bacterium]